MGDKLGVVEGVNDSVGAAVGDRIVDVTAGDGAFMDVGVDPLPPHAESAQDSTTKTVYFIFMFPVLSAALGVLQWDCVNNRLNF